MGLYLTLKEFKRTVGGSVERVFPGQQVVLDLRSEVDALKKAGAITDDLSAKVPESPEKAPPPKVIKRDQFSPEEYELIKAWSKECGLPLEGMIGMLKRHMLDDPEKDIHRAAYKARKQLGLLTTAELVSDFSDETGLPEGELQADLEGVKKKYGYPTPEAICRMRVAYRLGRDFAEVDAKIKELSDTRKLTFRQAVRAVEKLWPADGEGEAEIQKGQRVMFMFSADPDEEETECEGTVIRVRKDGVAHVKVDGDDKHYREFSPDRLLPVED